MPACWVRLRVRIRLGVTVTHYYYYYYCDYYCDYDDYLLGRATHSHPVEPRGHGRLAVRQGGEQRVEHVDDEVARVAHLSKARRDRVSSRQVWGLFGGGSSPVWHT